MLRKIVKTVLKTWARELRKAARLQRPRKK